MKLDFLEILTKEGYTDWKVIIINSGGGLCLLGRKEIWIDETKKDSLPFFLHEVAHIKYPTHDANWADHYTALVEKYLDEMLSKDCLLHKDTGKQG